MAALSLARERAPATPFLIVTGSVNEETAVGCMKAGATDYLLKSNLARIGPAIEAALARVRARTEKARAEEALRRSEANLRAIFNTSLQAFVLVDRDGTMQALNPTARGLGDAHPRPPAAGGRPHPRLHPRGRRSVRAALAGEARSVERRLRGAGRGRALVRDHPRPGGGRARPRHRGQPQRPGRERAQARRAGAPGERGPLPRPVRQRQRPGVHHRPGRGASST